MFNELEIVRSMRQLFGPNGEHWTQNSYATNESGDHLWPEEDSATAWCLIGGYLKVIHEKVMDIENTDQVLLKAVKEYAKLSIVYFNDNNPWPKVDEFLDWWENRCLQN